MDFPNHATSQGNWGVWISVPHFMHIHANIHRMVFLSFGINIKKRICCHRDVRRHPAPAQSGDEPAERSEVVDWESCQLHWRTTDSPLKHASSECRVNRACLDTGREINQTLKVLQEKSTGTDLSRFGRENWIKLCFLTRRQKGRDVTRCFVLRVLFILTTNKAVGRGSHDNRIFIFKCCTFKPVV